MPNRLLSFLLIFPLLFLVFSCNEEESIRIEQWEYNESDIVTTSSGLQYVIHEQGTGNPPQQGATVSVHYSGFLTNGDMFDSSVQRNNPFMFMLGMGQVIQGWDEGVALMREGERRTLIIPHTLGYGDAGSPPVIPPRATIIFDVELLGFSNP